MILVCVQPDAVVGRGKFPDEQVKRRRSRRIVRPEVAIEEIHPGSIEIRPCGERSATICVVLGPKESSMYCIPANTSPVFPDLLPRICQRLLPLATKNYSDRLLAFGFREIALLFHLFQIGFRFGL